MYTSAIVIITVAACIGKDDPDGLARSFVDAYYVEYDFQRALSYADGAARLRLDDEKKLVDDARQKVAVADSRSRTYYESPSRRDVGPELIHYTFDLEIHHGSSDIRRTAIVMLAKRQGAWKVIGFRENTPASTGAGTTDAVRTSTGAAP